MRDALVQLALRVDARLTAGAVDNAAAAIAADRARAAAWAEAAAEIDGLGAG